MIEKGKPERLFPRSDSWHPADHQELFKLAEALSDPIRQWVFLTLQQGPMRQAELARRASEHFGKKISNIHMSYHLKRLEEAGLVRFEVDPFSRAKTVHLAVEVRVEIRNIEEEIPRVELTEELMKALKGRS